MQVGKKLPLPEKVNRAEVIRDVWNSGGPDVGSQSGESIPRKDPISVSLETLGLNGAGNDLPVSKPPPQLSAPPGFMNVDQFRMDELEHIGMRNCFLALAVDQWKYRCGFSLQTCGF